MQPLSSIRMETVPHRRGRQLSCFLTIIFLAIITAERDGSWGDATAISHMTLPPTAPIILCDGKVYQVQQAKWLGKR